MKASRRDALYAILVIILLLPITNVLVSPQTSFSSAVVSSSDAATSTTSVSNAQSLAPVSLSSSGYTKIPAEQPAVLEQAKPLGILNPSTPISVKMILPLRNPEGLSLFLKEVNDPPSTLYHQYLTSQRFDSLYGPDGAEAASLVSYLNSKGLKTNFDSLSSYVLQASGSAAQIERALQISLQSFEYNNKTFYATTSSPELPSRFADIQSIYGLENYDSSTVRGAQPMVRTLGTTINNPSASVGNFLYYSPSEIRQAYNATSLYSAGYIGSGVGIAIVDAFGDPYIQQELDNFSLKFGLPNATVHVICVDGPCNYSSGIAQGWNVEIALDVEWAHAMAPGATINLYIGKNSSQPLYDAVQKAITDGTNSIISMSWGIPENDIAASSPVAPVFGQNYPWLDQVFQQAAAEGITCFASTGDAGAYDQGSPYGQAVSYGGPNYPSTDPFVTGVGGTALYMNTTSGFYQLPYFNATGTFGQETAWSWNVNYQWATGGGYSSLFNQPDWQRGAGVPQGGTRGAPDVAWDADVQTGVIVSVFDPSSSTYTYEIVGGTSVGSPSWAGSIAVLDQKAGTRLGLINPILYSILNDKSKYSKAFHDITAGNNNPYNATPGWDPLTGLGSPNLGELANFIAPSGALTVAATHSLTAYPSMSYAVGTTITLSAVVKNSNQTVGSGNVLANITCLCGSAIATNIPLAYNSALGKWLGSYTVKSSDPSGQWSATISATSGSLSGKGYASFSVGDGITLFAPYYNISNGTFNSPYFQAGDTIHVSAAITYADGSCCVQAGSFGARFNLNTPTGASEGSIPLKYNSTSNNWEGSYKIPKTVDQGVWILTVSGVDSSGNKGSTYGWVNVGLNVLLATDFTNYVPGDNITILSAPVYKNGQEATTGKFVATISHGSEIIKTIPLTYFSVFGLWVGFYEIKQTDPSGYYTVTVNGSDGRGNYGSFSTVTRVAPHKLSISITLPSSEISVNGGSQPWVSAKISYPNGTSLTTGSIEAYVFLDQGQGVRTLMHRLRMTFQSDTRSFVAPDVLKSLGPEQTLLGKYDVNILAFDAYGNFGNVTLSFYVTGTSHAPITISSNADFTPANGVIGGSGTISDPYMIAGWNTTSITISGGVSASYELLNNWVEGSAGNGITVDGPQALGSALVSDYSLGNKGNGVYINNVEGAYVNSVVASNNGKNGIVLANDSGGYLGSITGNVVLRNGENGILVQDSTNATVTFNTVLYNANDGILIDNSANATVGSNTIYDSQNGIEITGSKSFNYGVAGIFVNDIESNNIGTLIDGLGQVATNSTNLAASALIEYNDWLNNSIGILAENQAIIDVKTNVLGFNNLGIVTKNSLAVVVNNNIGDNFGTGLNITGQFDSQQFCHVTYPNSSVFLYSACVAENLFDANGEFQVAGGFAINNLNGSFVYLNNATNNSENGIELNNVSNSLIQFNFADGNFATGLNMSSSAKNIINQNGFDSNVNGLLIDGGRSNAISHNNATFNTKDGIALQGVTNSTISGNKALNNTAGCNVLSDCSKAAGIHLSDSSGNLLTSNVVENNQGSQSSTGFGILLDSNSSANSLFQNLVSQNVAGIGFENSLSNLATQNNVSENKYGLYFLNGTGNVYAMNSFRDNLQDVYPIRPSVVFTSPQSDTTVNDIVNITWSVTGQAISSEKLTVDGMTQTAVSGSSFAWDTSRLLDGRHTLTLNVTNTGGFWTTSTLVVSTNNVYLRSHFIIVQTVAPGGTPLSGMLVKVTNSTFQTNGMTDSTGQVIFKGLFPGRYTISSIINGTLLSTPITLVTNTTVVLEPPIISTTAYAQSASRTVQIDLKGNVTSAQLSDIKINSTNGVYSLSFIVTGINGTVGTMTLTIPKSAIPSGLTPSVLVDGVLASKQSYTEDANSYYVTFSTHFSTHHVSIVFSSNIIQLAKYVILAVVITALLLGGLVYYVRKRRLGENYYGSLA